MNFDKNVFINCPFDEKYLELLRPLLFTVIYLGFTPRIAFERIDSGRPRIERIISLIEESHYAIHDLSRIRASRKGEYFRLNMPFELGVDIGCRLFKSGRWNDKRCLILEAERYRFQKAISDLSNSDIGVHNNQPEEVISEVRNWLNNEAGLRAPGPSEIWTIFLKFMADNYDELKSRGFSDRDINRLHGNELIACIHGWVEKNS